MDDFAFLLPVIFCAFGLTFLVVGHHERRAAPWWGAGFLTGALAFTMPVLPDGLPGPFRSMMADTLFLLALSFHGQGLLTQFRRRVPLWPRIAIVALGIIASVVSTLFLENPTVSLAANDLLTSLCLAVPACAVVRHARRPLERLLVGIVFAIIVDTLVRNIVMTVLNRNPGDFQTFLASPYAFLMQSTSAVLGVLLALTALGCVVMEIIGRYKDVAERDPLTGLLNRRGFERLSGQRAVTGSVIVCDIDHFKRVNDRYGHAAGDAVIGRLARILAFDQVDEAVLARFGGEEFVLFLPGVVLHVAASVAHAMHARIGSADWAPVGVDAVTASFGVAASRGGDMSIYEVVARADRALYAAKTGGRNRVFVEGERLADRRPPPARAVA